MVDELLNNVLHDKNLKKNHGSKLEYSYKLTLHSSSSNIDSYMEIIFLPSDKK